MCDTLEWGCGIVQKIGVNIFKLLVLISTILQIMEGDILGTFKI